jgi:hypothetical protein
VLLLIVGHLSCVITRVSLIVDGAAADDDDDQNGSVFEKGEKKKN